MVRLTLLASGSRGNCALLATSRTRLLVDAGISCRETLKRLAAAGEHAAIDAVLISHEHSDHIAGLYGLARKLRVPVYITGAAHQQWTRWARNGSAGRNANGEKPCLEKLELFEPGHSFHVGDVAVTPFTVPHDAADPVGFTFRAEGVKLGFLTDLGYLPASVKHHLRGCDGLVIESNHDLEMLRGGPYPWAVKQRVLSRTGHLSNESLAEFFGSDYDGSAAFVVLAHLSEENNHPEVARRQAEQALQGRRTLLRNRVLLASQSQPLPALTF